MFGNRKSKINVRKQHKEDLAMLMNVHRFKKPPPPSKFSLRCKSQLTQAKRPKSGTVNQKWNMYSSATMTRANPNENSLFDQARQSFLQNTPVIGVNKESRTEFPSWFTNMVQHQIASPSPSSTLAVSSSNASSFVQGSWIERKDKGKVSQSPLMNPDFTKKFSLAELVDVMCGNTELESLIQNEEPPQIFPYNLEEGPERDSLIQEESAEIFSSLPVLQDRTNSAISTMSNQESIGGLDFLQSNYNSMPFHLDSQPHCASPQRPKSRTSRDTGVLNGFMQQEEQNAMPFDFEIQPLKQKRPKSRKRRQTDDAWDGFVQVLQQKQNSMPFDFETAQSQVQQQQRPTSRTSFDPNQWTFSPRPQQDFLGGLAVIQSNYNSVALDFDSQQSQSLTQSQFNKDCNSSKWDAFVDPFSI